MAFSKKAHTSRQKGRPLSDRIIFMAVYRDKPLTFDSLAALVRLTTLVSCVLESISLTANNHESLKVHLVIHNGSGTSKVNTFSYGKINFEQNQLSRRKQFNKLLAICWSDSNCTMYIIG